MCCLFLRTHVSGKHWCVFTSIFVGVASTRGARVTAGGSVLVQVSLGKLHIVTGILVWSSAQRKVMTNDDKISEAGGWRAKLVHVTDARLRVQPGGRALCPHRGPPSRAVSSAGPNTRDMCEISKMYF